MNISSTFVHALALTGLWKPAPAGGAPVPVCANAVKSAASPLGNLLRAQGDSAQARSVPRAAQDVSIDLHQPQVCTKWAIRYFHFDRNKQAEFQLPAGWEPLSVADTRVAYSGSQSSIYAKKCAIMQGQPTPDNVS